MAKFKVGDRVVVAKNYGPVKKGLSGVVLSAASSTLIAVSFDGFKNGHNADGLVPKWNRPKDSGYYLREEFLQLLVEEAKPETEKPPVEPTKPKPTKPAYNPWDISKPISSDTLEELLGMSIDIKPASEWTIQKPPEAAVSGNWTAPKPQAQASKPKPEPKKETKPRKDGCCKCAAYKQIADCEYGFCSSWHNFAGKEELCSRFKAVDTVDK